MTGKLALVSCSVTTVVLVVLETFDWLIGQDIRIRWHSCLPWRVLECTRCKHGAPTAKSCPRNLPSIRLGTRGASASAPYKYTAQGAFQAPGSVHEVQAQARPPCASQETLQASGSMHQVQAKSVAPPPSRSQEK